MLVVEHDQVGQIRSRQEERRGVGHEHGPVEVRQLVAAASPGEVEQDRRQEEDRRVEVQDRCDDGDEAEREREGRARPRAKTCEAGAGGGEQPVTFRDHTDEQQTGDEGERRPDLTGCGP